MASMTTRGWWCRAARPWSGLPMPWVAAARVDPRSRDLYRDCSMSLLKPATGRIIWSSSAYSGSASFVVHSGCKAASNLNARTERTKRSQLQVEDNARRDKLHYESHHILESVDSPLVSVDLEQGVINYANFMKYRTKEDQQQLFKLLPPMDSSTPLESLRSMFSSIQFADAIHSYQRLLGEGILDPYFSSSEERNTVKKLALTNLTKREWLECYKQQKENEIEETEEEDNISGSRVTTKSTMKTLTRPRDRHFQSCAELKVTTRSPQRLKKYEAFVPLCKSSSLANSGYGTKDLTFTGEALNLFMLSLEKLSLLVPPQYTGDNSDQDLLLEIPLNARHPEAELLYGPSQLSSVTRSSTSVVGVAEGEGCLKQP